MKNKILIIKIRGVAMLAMDTDGYSYLTDPSTKKWSDREQDISTID